MESYSQYQSSPPHSTIPPNHPFQPPPAYTTTSGAQQSLSQLNPQPFTEFPATMSESSNPDRLPSFTTNLNRLQKPIAIPATLPKVGSPFLRSYPPCLQEHGIDRATFLDFLDHFNRTTVQSPPLQILGLAGSAVSFIPLHTAQIVGGAVNAAAQLGTVVVSKGRTELFLREANREVFMPKGLKIEVARLDALAKIADIPVLDSRGKLKKDSTLLEPLGMEDLVRCRSGEQTFTGQQRRLQALEEYIAHLEIDELPASEPPTNPLSRLHAGASAREQQKGEKKLVKTGLEAAERYNKDGQKAMKKYEKEMNKQNDKLAKLEMKGKGGEKVAKVEEEKQKIQNDFDKEMRKVEKDRRKDDKGEAGMRKILWLIIRNLDEEVEGENPDLPE